MQKLVYYVATSLDGYIAGPNGDISQFVLQGHGVEKYQSDLQSYQVVIMGRNTYEFGYQYGLTPGQPAYPRMQHHVFSNQLEIEDLASSVHIEPISIQKVKDIKVNSPGDIYLCGGGQFAGWLLEHGLIDRLKLKVNPIVLGGGIKLFGDAKAKANWKVIDTETYSDGIQILSFDLA